ncbi:MAG: DUF3800 domain-containing protein [Gammaproteobacteria bacterium]|nr:DUF3800 domain-containing protein [Gammaproteobacteria bacterium]
MATQPLAQTIYCDEAGFTGNHLLDEQQPAFAYASVAIEKPEAEKIVRRLHAGSPLQGPELKGARLAKSARGRAVIVDALRSIRGCYIATVHHKRFSLACKFFEYIYEPVLARNNSLFYAHGFHRFVAALIYVNFLLKDEPTEDLVRQFETFMRTLNPADAPILFGGAAANATTDEALLEVARFIDGYRDVILEESQYVGNWVLDLSLSALFPQIALWGERFDVISVYCDDSKPLRELTPVLNAMIGRTERTSMVFGGKRRPLTFNLAQPVQLVSSASHAGVQLADVVSSALVKATKEPESDWSQTVLAEVQPHIHEDCVVPDLTPLDLETPKNVVNAFVLRELGERAERGADPLSGMPEFYQLAHANARVFLSNSV